MDKLLGQCAAWQQEANDNKIVVCKEKGKVYQYQNAACELCDKEKKHSLHRLAKIRVSESDSENRCDFLLINKCAKDVIFIELKGSDLLHATGQITSTLGLLDVKKALRVFGRIVTSSVHAPDTKSTKYIKLDRLFRSKGGNLKHHQQLFIENFSQLSI